MAAAVAAHATRRTVSDAAAATAGGSDVVDISWWKLALVVALLAIPLTASRAMRLGLDRPLLIAASRCLAQLLILGVVLRSLFTTQHPAYVLLYVAFMVAVASVEATSRPAYAYPGMHLDMVLSLATPSLLTLAYMLIVIIRPPKWWAPQYMVPLCGMMLGNGLNGVTVGVKAFLEALSAERQAVEWALAMGATRWEAVWPVFQRVLQTAMTPTVNMLSVAGLVSIPGMMTGQILAGSDALVAAKYQILILFGVGAASTVACLLAMCRAALALTDASHRLRLDRLIEDNVTLPRLAWQLIARGSRAVRDCARRLLDWLVPWQRDGAAYEPIPALDEVHVSQREGPNTRTEGPAD